MKKILFISTLLICFNVTHAEILDRLDFAGPTYRTFLDSIIESMGYNNYFKNLFTTFTPLPPDLDTQSDRQPIASTVDEFNDNTDAKKAVQEFLGVKVDGIIGRKTTGAIKNFQENNSLKPTGKVDSPTLDKLNEIIGKNKKEPDTSNNPENENYNLGGSGKGDAIGLMRGTNFCTTIQGNPDRDGVSSCGSNYGDCKNLGKNPNQETIELCKKCPDCKYVMGSCGTPLYFYKGNVNNPQVEANKSICAVALTQNKLVEVFKSSKQSAYCSKSVKVCNGLDNCKFFPVRDTGHARADTIDMTGCVFKELKITDDVNPVKQLTVFRIEDKGDKSKVQVAESGK